jgi:hypothetical protein
VKPPEEPDPVEAIQVLKGEIQLSPGDEFDPIDLRAIGIGLVREVKFDRSARPGEPDRAEREVVHRGG